MTYPASRNGRSANSPDPRALAARVMAGGDPFQLADRPDWFSFSSFDAFGRCPRQYALRYLCRVPVEVSRPAAEFGSAAHAAFEAFTRRRREAATCGEPRPTRADLDRYFEAAWARTCLPSEADAADWRGRAEAMLDKFWAAEQAAASAAPDDAAPAAQIEECSPGTVGEELRFRLRLVLDPLTTVAVGGFIDRVDRSASGDLEVIDYKTGRAATGVEADSSLQLSLYALACRDALRLGRPQRVTLYFVEHGVRISADRSDAALEGVRADLVGRAREIRASRFGPTPGTRACGWCDFGSMCDAAAREPAAGSQPIS